MQVFWVKKKLNSVYLQEKKNVAAKKGLNLQSSEKSSVEFRGKLKFSLDE